MTVTRRAVSRQNQAPPAEAGSELPGGLQRRLPRLAQPSCADAILAMIDLTAAGIHDDPYRRRPASRRKPFDESCNRVRQGVEPRHGRKRTADRLRESERRRDADPYPGERTRPVHHRNAGEVANRYSSACRAEI